MARLPRERDRRWAVPGFAVLLTLAGLLLRFHLAWTTFLNPDEALHYSLSRQPSLRLAYEVSLTTAHPPLMILFLHCWARLGNSEFFLRMPFVFAGILFCWVMFLWVEKVANRTAAWFTLALFLFSPSLISLSAEIRQYSFTLLFCSCCLYFLEHSFERNSAKWVVLSGAALYLALLTHYSALIFAATAGVYGLIRLLDLKRPAALWASWLATEAGALAICIFLFHSQISPLQRSGVPSEIASTWLRSSIFHRGEDHLLIFVWTRSVRLFRYFFSHGTIGVLGLILFVFAIALLLWPANRTRALRRQRATGMLLLLPFVITVGTAIAGIYPYGGTRHDALLALFAFSGIAIGIDRLPLPRISTRPWVRPGALAAGLTVCNISPSPTGPYIRPAHQRRELMQQAVRSLRSLPANSVILTDTQNSMVLNYYLCPEATLLPATTTSALANFPCGNYKVLASANDQAGFNRAEFPALLEQARKAVPGEKVLYLFQSGWINDHEDEWLAELRGLGGSPENFGPNILLCPIRKVQQVTKAKGT